MKDKRVEIEAELSRNVGPTPTQKASLKEAWDQMGDWYGWCRKCGKRLKGTPKALQAHVCDGEKK